MNINKVWVIIEECEGGNGTATETTNIVFLPPTIPLWVIVKYLL